MYILSCISF